MKVTSSPTIAGLEFNLKEANADFDSVSVHCDSVDNSSSGLVYVAKFKVAPQDTKDKEKNLNDHQHTQLKISEAVKLLRNVIPADNYSMNNLCIAIKMLRKLQADA